MRAAFDFPAEPPDRERRLRGQFRTAPVQVLRAETADDVRAVLAAAEAAAQAGNWVLGGVPYSGAWDAAQHVQRDPGIPAAYFEVYSGSPEPWADAPTTIPALEWHLDPSLADGATPAAGVQTVLDHIAAGDCYQVNLTTRAHALAPSEPDSLHRLFVALAAAQPGGYALYLAGAGVASVSPELFFDKRGQTLTTQPMKGTAPADSDPAELLASPKERAENLMIVDLLRNDLGRVCLPGTIRTDRLFELHRLPTVWQLTSTVSGQTPPRTSLAEVFDALFPCGSVTGAPKLAAMEVIADLEADSRGWYCGALGIIRPGGQATFNVAIRTVTASGNRFSCSVGSGIVADSVPAAEVAEWRLKTRFLGGDPPRALETMLLVDGVFVRLAGHLARLRRTCDELGLNLDLVEVETALAEAATVSGRHRVRLVAGDGPPQIELSPAPPTETPVVLGLATEPLDASGELGPVIRNKTTHRAHYARLRETAASEVFDVICVNARGELTECTTGNLAVCLDGRWYTPPESAGLLPGVLRAELLASGALEERTLLASELDRCEGLAFFNSLRGWCPARIAEAAARDGRPPG